jgi:spore coat protein SA
MIYHILPEAEPFSEHHGGALSRWTANVLKDDDSAAIFAPWTDGSWKFDSRHVRPLERLRLYGKFVRACRGRVSPAVRRFLAQRTLRTVFTHAAPGDVIYVHNRPEFAAAIHAACPGRQFKLVLHMHNSHLLLHPGEYARCADLTAFCSAFLLDQARQCVGEIRSTVIPNGADGACFFPGDSLAQTCRPTVLFVGCLTPAKGAHVLTEAMRILQRRGSGARAVVVGSAAFGADRETSYVRRLKADAPANVEFAPYQTGSALAGHYRQATVFCCPSVFEEPFGMVNVEAMACGLPVVAAEAGGIPEVFREGGALLVARNDPATLADALDRMLRDAGLRTRLAQEARRSYRKNFTWEVVRGKYIEALASLAA